ncbi:putative starch synthase 4, chloroplastic/amyloplastic [Ananas comosus]|uniref:Starch synthase, chloroplastic/amyloplastic n=1 Tax=Ananas comosus TaxID=4615 RepID=A0A199VEN8_ANACO|nr:putative starch synthase 4, chloroplastic/amyloplastic [Ananas comosus]
MASPPPHPVLASRSLALVALSLSFAGRGIEISDWNIGLVFSIKLLSIEHSEHRKRQAKRISPKQSPLNMAFQPPGEEKNEAPDSTSDSTLHNRQNTLSGTILETDVTAAGRRREELPNVRPEDLIGMIKNAQKNILLLNQARVRALEDADKILAEKESLQAEINVLEMKLAETDAQLKVAAQEKVNVELLEDQIERLKRRMVLRDTREGGTDVNTSESPLGAELNALREENMVLKDDIQTLKSKLTAVRETEERVGMLEKERSTLEVSFRELESKFAISQDDVMKLVPLQSECKALWEKVGNLQTFLDNLTKQAEQAASVLQQNHELQKKVEKLEASLEAINESKLQLEKSEYIDELLQQKVKTLEEHLQISDQEMHSLIELYQESVKEFQDALNKLKEESERRSLELDSNDMPGEFWSQLLLTVDGWFLEKKISSNDAKLLREMVWKRDSQIRDAYLACKGMGEREIVAKFLKLTLHGTSPGLHIVHIAAEMAPVAKVGGLGDVVSGLCKALQRKGHLVEIVVPKYDCMNCELITDLKVLDVVVQSYFDGQQFNNKIWVGTVEGLPVYFIEPHHPARFFLRGQYYGEHDDFKRFSFFSRAALELVYQAGKKPDIIHCHDWQTAFVAPLYWDIYATRGFDSARICFTCHNFEYQGTAPASELASCGLDVDHLNRPDRMQDRSAHDRINTVKGAIVYSNIVTTVSPTYAQEVRSAEGGRGLNDTLKFHARKFVGILNGIDTDTWNPSSDSFVRVQYNADDLQGKAANKDAVRKHMNLSTKDASQPLVGCITRLVPQKGVHLIRHAIYKTLELGGQFVLLGSSPVPYIQREFEGIANHFQSNPHVRLLLKYDDALSHLIYAASDLFVIPSIFEPCGLTQMIAMRYGSVPIVRKTGGLNDSVFDIDDKTIPVQFRNGFTFVKPDEQALSSAMERAFKYYNQNPEIWQQLVQKVMRMDFSWDSSAAQYEELYEMSVARARASARA